MENANDFDTERTGAWAGRSVAAGPGYINTPLGTSRFRGVAACGHPTAQGEIWQTSFPGRNAEMSGTSEKAAAKQSRSKPATILTNDPGKADWQKD